MTMQDQTRKAFGHYARRQTARAKAGNLGSFTKALADMEPEINPLDVGGLERGDLLTSATVDRLDKLKNKVDDLELPSYVTPDSSAMDFDGDSLPDEKSYSRLSRRSHGYEVRDDDYVKPPKAEDMSFTDALVNLEAGHVNKAYADAQMRSFVNSDDVIIARPDVAKELGSTVVNGFGDVAKVVSSDDIGYDFDGDSLLDEKSYSRLAKRARGYEAGNLTDDYVQPSKYDDYVQPPKYDDYVQPPTVSEFDVSQFEMSNNEATNVIDDEPMSTIDEGQFNMGPSKGLQQ